MKIVICHDRRAKGLAKRSEILRNQSTKRDLPQNAQTSLSPRALVNEGFALRIGFSLTELEQALVNGEELQNQPSGTDGYSLAAKIRTRSGQEERSGGRGGRNSGKGRDNEARGSHDG